MQVKCNIEKCKYNKNNSCNKDFIEIGDSSNSEDNYSTCNSYEENTKYIKTQYHIEKLPKNNFNADYLIIINNCNTGQEYISHIMNDLPKDKKVINIIFDHLLHNGNNSDRYILVNWNIKNTYSSADKIDVPKKDIVREISCNYFKTRPELIENSILGSVQKKMILKGIVI